MVTLRNFTEADLPVLREYFAPGQTDEQILETLREWETKTFRGRYFQMFAVCDGEEIVGTVSLYQHGSCIISAGPEIFPPFRRKGYGEAGLRLAYARAKEQGYKIASVQIRTNNAASIRLHEKLGFLRDCEVTNRKGNPVYIYLKQL